MQIFYGYIQKKYGFLSIFLTDEPSFHTSLLQRAFWPRQAKDDRSMEADVVPAPWSNRRSPDNLAELLVRLFDERFGGASSGRFRISRKFLRKLAGRRRLSDEYLIALAEEMFEAGFVFVDCESYSIVLSQRQFASYRRVTAMAVNKVTSYEDANNEAKVGGGIRKGRLDTSEIGDHQAQNDSEIH